MLIVPGEKEACEVVKYYSKEWKRIIKDIDLEDLEGTRKALTESIHEYNQLQRLKPYGRSLRLTEAGGIEQSKLDPLIEFSRGASYKITLSAEGLPTKNIEDLTIDEAKEYYEAIKKEREGIKKIIKEQAKAGTPVETWKQEIYLIKERCALALRVIGELSGGEIPADMLNEYQKILNNPSKNKPNSNTKFTGYWKPEQGFENIPKFNDKRAELLRWVRKCDSVDGYPLFRLYQKEGVKYPLHSVLISCYGGEPLPEGEESWWLRDVPEYVLDRLEREVNGYNWLISYIVEGVEEKTGNPNGNPNGNPDNPHNNPNHKDPLWLRKVTDEGETIEDCKWDCNKAFEGCIEGREADKEFCLDDCINNYDEDSEDLKKCIKKCNKEYEDGVEWCENDATECFAECKRKERREPAEAETWQQREATQERILDRLKLKESGVKIDEPPLLVTVGATHTVVGEVDGLKLNFVLGEIAREDTLLFDTFRFNDRLWHVKKSIALSTLKGRQKARDKREGEQMKMYEEWGGLAKFEKKEEEKPKETLFYKYIKKELDEGAIAYTSYPAPVSEIIIAQLPNGRWNVEPSSPVFLEESFKTRTEAIEYAETNMKMVIEEEAGAKPPETEEVWTMTKGNFLLSKYAIPMKPREARKHHREQVEKAFKEGKLVPEAVLKDYPELKPTKKESLEAFRIRHKELFNKIDEALKTHNLHPTEYYITGSFVSRKKKPSDIDVVFVDSGVRSKSYRDAMLSVRYEGLSLDVVDVTTTPYLGTAFGKGVFVKREKAQADYPDLAREIKEAREEEQLSGEMDAMVDTYLPKEEYKPTTVIEKLADDALHKRGWWQDKL